VKRSDLGPDEKLMKLGGPNAHRVAEGDVLYEHGPRIGQRYWLVVLIEHARTLWHVAAHPLNAFEAQQSVADGGTIWSLT
jgi:hypothetical protein